LDPESAPWGKRQSLAAALAYGLVNAGMGWVTEVMRGVMGVMSLLLALVLFWAQVGSRPLRWIPWACLLLSLVAVASVDLGAFTNTPP
jgi:hypothetical protein